MTLPAALKLSLASCEVLMPHSPSLDSAMLVLDFMLSLTAVAAQGPGDGKAGDGADGGAGPSSAGAAAGRGGKDGASTVRTAASSATSMWGDVCVFVCVCLRVCVPTPSSSLPLFLAQAMRPCYRM